MKKIPKRYYGKFVAVSGFGSYDIIASGNNEDKVSERANKKCKHPLIFYCNDPNKGILNGVYEPLPPGDLWERFLRGEVKIKDE